MSIGPPLVTVPSVVGTSQTAATAAITGAGLTVTTTTASSATVAAGNVISQLPIGGATAVVGSAVALVVSSGPAAPLGLVAAFGFEEAAGTAVLDSSPAPTNGTLLGALRVATGKIGRALSFDGVNDWVTVTDTTASKIDLTTGMTIEAWVNPAAMSGWETVVLKERGGAGTGLLSVRPVCARRRAAGRRLRGPGRLSPCRRRQTPPSTRGSGRPCTRRSR